LCKIRYPNQQSWIVRATNGNGLINCKTQEETIQTVKAVFEVKKRKHKDSAGCFFVETVFIGVLGA